MKAAKIEGRQELIKILQRRIYKWTGSARGFADRKPVYVPAPKVLEWLIKELENG